MKEVYGRELKIGDYFLYNLSNWRFDSIAVGMVVAEDLGCILYDSGTFLTNNKALSQKVIDILKL